MSRAHESRVYEYALKLLSARAYTARSLRRKLLQREFDSTEVDAAVDRLLSSGLLDDARFAAELARQRLVSGGSSVRRVEQELAKKGIARETARAAIDLVRQEEPVDIAQSIERAARKKLLSMGDLEPSVRRRRLFAFLARRGFELEDIKWVIENHFPSR